jgi:hypothetical protein
MSGTNGTTNPTMQRLKEAAERATAGENPYDTFLSYGLTVEDAGAWCALWAQQLASDARKLGQNPRSQEFTYRLMLGALAVGVEFGRTSSRR